MSTNPGILLISNCCFELRQSFVEKIPEVRHFQSRSANETRSLCKSLSEKDVRAVILIGGDGTVNSVLPFLKGKRIPLLVIPGGTANDLSRETGVAGTKWESQIESILKQGRMTEADVVQASRGHCFVTVGGYGIGARVTAAYDRLRQRSRFLRGVSSFLGPVVYKILSVSIILFGKNLNHRIRVESDTFRGALVSAAGFVANQERLGGGIQVARGSKNDDGMFEVTLLPEQSRLGLILTLLKLSLGLECPGLIRFSSRKLKISDLEGRAIAQFGDGESFEACADLEYEISDERLLLLRAH